MTLVYEDPAVKILCGDALELLPGLGECDHLITDPPYFPAVEAGTRLTSEPTERRGFGFDAMTPDTAQRLLSLVQPRGWGLVFSDAEGAAIWRASIPSPWRFVRTGFWVKLGAQPQLSGDRPACHAESVTIYHSPKKCQWNGGGGGNVWTHMIARGAERPDHPTPKPLSLMRQLVQLFTQPGDLVLDPFGGSGTTARACKDLGRRCLMIDADPSHCETAAQRMAQEVLL